MRQALRVFLTLGELLVCIGAVPDGVAGEVARRGGASVRPAMAPQAASSAAASAASSAAASPSDDRLFALIALASLSTDTLESDTQAKPVPPLRKWSQPPPPTLTVQAGSQGLVIALTAALLLIVGLVIEYATRHYLFTLNRLFGEQRHPYLDIDIADWPTLTVMIAAHNEEGVIAGSLACLLRSDYPADRLTIMPVNDRSSDRTRAIIDDFVMQYPGRISPFHRSAGKPGKAAALKDATERVTSDTIVVFDADYLPPVGLLKQLVAPFFDPEVGATMGRVVPMNLGTNLLTRLLDLERSGGYQVDQQARMNLNLVPQYGGTVGGVRMRALKSVGGWHDDVLAEDTDLTYRLLLSNWKTIYQNWSECYEEVPETWPVRVRQIMRWTKGHNQALYRHGWKMATCRDHNLLEKIDGVALLGIYMMAPLMLCGWLLAIILFYASGLPLLGAAIFLFALMSYGTLGNFAAFFEIAAAVYLDGSRERICLLPLNYFGFLVSVLTVSRAIVNQIAFDFVLRREIHWDKTRRYR